MSLVSAVVLGVVEEAIRGATERGGNRTPRRKRKTARKHIVGAWREEDSASQPSQRATSGKPSTELIERQTLEKGFVFGFRNCFFLSLVLQITATVHFLSQHTFFFGAKRREDNEKNCQNSSISSRKSCRNKHIQKNKKNMFIPTLSCPTPVRGDS